MSKTVTRNEHGDIKLEGIGDVFYTKDNFQLLIDDATDFIESLLISGGSKLTTEVKILKSQQKALRFRLVNCKFSLLVDYVVAPEKKGNADALFPTLCRVSLTEEGKTENFEIEIKTSPREQFRQLFLDGGLKDNIKEKLAIRKLQEEDFYDE